MDTSETYIKMCEKAEELHKEWYPSNGDFIIQVDYPNLPSELRQPVILHFCNDEVLVNFDKDIFIWLPRQDQLQEMISDSHLYKLAKFMAMLGYSTSSYGGLGVYKHQDAPRHFLDASMEQLWLAFVMKEKYNKVWNGDEWILI